MLGTTAIESAQPNWPVTRLAKLALRELLLDVPKHLRRAAEDWKHEVEHVHQLRVATRRASAALIVFEEYMPRSRRRWTSKRLRRIRRIAGMARDLDVLAQRMRQDSQPADGRQTSATAAGILSRVEKLRQRVQKPLLKEYRGLKRKHYKAKVEALVDRVRWRANGAEQTVRRGARKALRPLISEFFRAAKEDLSDIHTLHRLRISGKRLRYAMELFSGAFDHAERDAVYPVFIELQRMLGDINDHVTARSLYERCRNDSTSQIERRRFNELADEESHRIEDASIEFHEWWTHDKVADLSQRFLTLLD